MQQRKLLPITIQIYPWEASVLVLSSLSLYAIHWNALSLAQRMENLSYFHILVRQSEAVLAGTDQVSALDLFWVQTWLAATTATLVTTPKVRTLRLKVSHGNWFTFTTMWSETNCSAFRELNCFQYMQLLKPSLHSTTPTNWVQSWSCAFCFSAALALLCPYRKTPHSQKIWCYREKREVPLRLFLHRVTLPQIGSILDYTAGRCSTWTSPGAVSR